MKIANKDLNTFEGWKKDGRFVVKGQKAHGFNHDGKALFRKDQADAIRPRCLSDLYFEEDSFMGNYASEDDDPFEGQVDSCWLNPDGH